MDLVTSLMGLFIYIVPFIILYFVISLGVRKGIETSEVGRVILEKYHEEKVKQKRP